MLNVLSALPGFIHRLTQEIQCIAKSMTTNCSAERPTRHSVLELSALDQCYVFIDDAGTPCRPIVSAAFAPSPPLLSQTALYGASSKAPPSSSAHFSASPPPIPQRTALSFHSSRKSEKNQGKNVSWRSRT